MIDNKEPSTAAINAVRALAAKQAADEGLWFSAAYASEAYLQNALRELAAAVEAMAVEQAPIPGDGCLNCERDAIRGGK